MTAMNVVRFRVKPGGEEDFIRAHREARIDAAGLRGADLIKTGERTYCFVGRWDSMEALAAGRSKMLPILDRFRHTLEELDGGLGVTDPVSGEVVVEIQT